MTILAYSEKPWKGIHYGKSSKFDQFSCQARQNRPGRSPKSLADLFDTQIASRFYASTTGSDTYFTSVLQNRLPRHTAVAQRFFGSPQRARSQEGAALHHYPESPAAADKKRAWDKLQSALFSTATVAGLIPTTQASIDSTGLESRFVSRHFLMRQGKRTSQYRRWTKLTIVADNGTHLIAAADISLGPSNDSISLPQAVRQAVEHIPIDCLLADAGYDAESNHVICRNELAIQSTVIPVNCRSRKQGRTTGYYRNQMKQDFPATIFGQRWQVESVFSRFKRKLGYALRATTEQSRATECFVRVLTYNLMILLFTFKYGFYRAICNLRFATAPLHIA